MREQTCCFTGHRHLTKNDIPLIQSTMIQKILELIHIGVRFFGTGGALGFDTLAALTILQLKAEYPEIRLILVLPCRDQARNWSQKDVAIYRNIMEQADKIVYISGQYAPGCMFKKNRHLVNHSKYCIYYLRHNKGGTAYTVQYAKEKGLITIPL